MVLQDGDNNGDRAYNQALPPFVVLMGGTTMGRKRDYWSGPGWRDLGKAMADLRASYGRDIGLTIMLDGSMKGQRLTLMAGAAPKPAPDGVVMCFTCVRADIAAGGVGALEAELLSLIYKLDFELMRDEQREAPADA